MIRSIVSKKALGLIAITFAVAASATTVFAQGEQPAQPSQISIQGPALVTKSSKDQIPSNDDSKTGGLLVGYSYQFSRWFGAEGNYGYTRNTQNFVTVGARIDADEAALDAERKLGLRHVRGTSLVIWRASGKG